MPRFDLRDISVRLSHSKSIHSALFELLRSIEEARADWRGTVAFYEASQDALVDVYERSETKLIRRHMTVRAETLPVGLVQKLFRGRANSNSGSPSVAKSGTPPEPVYHAQAGDGHALLPLSVVNQWESAVCLRLVDGEELLGILLLASPKKGAFGDKDLAEIIPVKRIATMALAHHLYRAQSERSEREALQLERQVMGAFEDHLEQLSRERGQLEEDNRAKSEELNLLLQDLQQVDHSTDEYRRELQQVKVKLFALEEQTTAAGDFLTTAHQDARRTQWELQELEQTLGFLKELFEVLGQEHDRVEFPHLMLSWFSEQFGFGRCTLMTPDESGETLYIAAEYGMDPLLVHSVRVRFGEGVAGWVAVNRKPLFVRVRDEAAALALAREGAYNSDSFIVVPLIHRQQLLGVLNVSNKRDGEPFTEPDLDRVLIAGAVLANILFAYPISAQAAGDRKPPQNRAVA